MSSLRSETPKNKGIKISNPPPLKRRKRNSSSNNSQKTVVHINGAKPTNFSNSYRPIAKKATKNDIESLLQRLKN